MDERLNWLISVDDHVIEPPNVWQDRVPAKLRDRAPRMLADADGEVWLWEGRRYPTAGLSAAAGKKREEFSPLPLTFSEMREGCYDPVARAADMDRDGVLASLLFPTFPRFAGPLFSETDDRELGFACIQAYNDWMIDEWCAAVPGRFIPMIIIPYWDGRLAAKEVERCAAKGARAVTFPENPVPLGFPSLHDRGRHWDPLFSAVAEIGIPLCTHIGSSGALPNTAPDAPMVISTALAVVNSQFTCTDWLYSGNFIRFPKLKLCLSEGGIGWIPYILERLDHVVETQRAWATKAITLDMSTGTATPDESAAPADDVDAFSVLPSVLFREHMYGCFIEDAFGAQNIGAVGFENTMIETDYPHTDSTWPNSLEIAHKRLQGLTDDQKWLVLQGNARRVFDFEPAAPPS
jgi:predicted TIM-barrel fold metal-dependent hydrolase